MSDERPGVISGWDLLPLTGNLLLGGFYAWIINQLPDPVPAHYNAAGLVDGWAPKSQMPLMIFGMPLFTWMLLLVIGWVLSRTQKNPVRARTMAVQPLRGFIGLGICAISVGALVAPLKGVVAIHWAMGVFFASVIIGLVATTRQTRQLLANESDASLYRWGLFYVNAGDPRIWVPKRVGVGKTLNYGRPASWVITLLFIALVAGMLVFLGQKR
jgi:uncharacterized membrane protein